MNFLNFKKVEIPVRKFGSASLDLACVAMGDLMVFGERVKLLGYSGWYYNSKSIGGFVDFLTRK